MSSHYHPKLEEIADAFNPELLKVGLSLDVCDEIHAGLDLFKIISTNNNFLWKPVVDQRDKEKYGGDRPMRFWPPITLKEILDWHAANDATIT